MTKITLFKTWSAILSAALCALALIPGQAAAEIRAESVLSESRPYVHQGAVLTVRIYSDRSLKSAEVNLPAVNGGIFTRLDEEWTARNAPGGGQQAGVISERRYLFTPLRAGRVEIPPVALEVIQEAAPAAYSQSAAQPYAYPGYGYPGYGQTYPQQTTPPQASGGTQKQRVLTPATTVEVASLPAQAASLPPLHGLRIDSRIQSQGEPRVGEPITLAIAVTGIGTTGERLPGVIEHMQTDEFKVYAERPQTEWQFDDRLQKIVGRRIETITLIPTREGPLELPIVEIPWWNLISGHAETARLTTAPIRVEAGAAGAGAAAADARTEQGQPAKRGVPLHTEKEDFWGFWLPVGGGLLLAFFIGWRMGMGHRRQKAAAAADGVVEDLEPTPSASPWAALAPAAARTRDAVSRVVPPSLKARRRSAGGDDETRELPVFTRRLLQGINAVLPRRLKIWTCMRCVQRAPEPGRICGIMRRFASECLGMPDNASIKSIGHAVASQRPTAETSSYLNLFGRLDDAAYGSGNQTFDMEQWKKDFQSHFGRLLRGSRRWARNGSRGGGLPQLNPR